LGVRVRVWEIGFFFALGLVVSGASKVAGALLVFCYLVVAPSAALLVTRRLTTALVLSAGVTLVSTLGGGCGAPSAATCRQTIRWRPSPAERSRRCSHGTGSGGHGGPSLYDRHPACRPLREAFSLSHHGVLGREGRALTAGRRKMDAKERCQAFPGTPGCTPRALQRAKDGVGPPLEEWLRMPAGGYVCK
jgi:hypothetical protein